MNKFFTLENRKKLKFLLSEGYASPIVIKKLNITKQAYYTELKKGLTEEEYKNRQYVKYDYVKSIEEEIRRYIGEESLAVIKEKYHE